MSSIEHIDQLLTLNGLDFVDAAYQVLLGRDAEPAGQKHYLNKLMQGAGKAAVVGQLAGSKECRARKVNLAGLDAVIAEQKRARHWFWGTLTRSFRMEKQANRLEFQLGELMDTVQKMHQQTGDRFARLDGWIAQGGAAPGLAGQPAHPVQVMDGGPASPWADTSSLSQPARQIFARLTQARFARETS